MSSRTELAERAVNEFEAGMFRSSMDALEVCVRDCFSGDHTELLGYLEVLGRVYLTSRSYDRAKSFYQVAMPVLLSTQGPFSLVVATQLWVVSDSGLTLLNGMAQLALDIYRCVLGWEVVDEGLSGYVHKENRWYHRNSSELFEFVELPVALTRLFRYQEQHEFAAQICEVLLIDLRTRMAPSALLERAELRTMLGQHGAAKEDLVYLSNCISRVRRGEITDDFEFQMWQSVLQQFRRDNYKRDWKDMEQKIDSRIRQIERASNT